MEFKKDLKRRRMKGKAKPSPMKLERLRKTREGRVTPRWPVHRPQQNPEEVATNKQQ